MFKCPFPKCDHIISDVLTHNHCEKAHGMSKDKVLKKYGEPKLLRINGEAYRKNLAMHQVIVKSRFRS
jgi:hypothetical protein